MKGKHMKNKVLLTILTTSTLWAGFDFSECSGVKTFEQQIEAYGNNTENAVEVGIIPTGIKGLQVTLESSKDIDIRLYGENNDKVVHWPNGILNEANEKTALYKGIGITYSGYNGSNGQKGHEFISLNGVTSTPMIIKAFGYQAGHAVVKYNWTGKEGCSKNGKKTGYFKQDILKNTITLVGDIPDNIENLEINLSSNKDIDIQLYGEDGTAIVKWSSTLANKGILSGSSNAAIDYNGMYIEWSGYAGVNGQAGDEYIKVTPKTTEKLTMKVFGYQAGEADVTYRWGNNTSNILFKSGFEDGVYIDPVLVEYSEDYDFIRGVDSQTGFSWPIDILGANESALHRVADDDNTALKSEIKTVEGYNGQSTKAMYNEETHREKGDTQLTYEILDITEGKSDLYVRYRMKIDSNMLGTINKWRALFEYKTKDYKDPGKGGTGFRLIAFIYTNNQGRASWHFQGDKDSSSPIWECDTLKLTPECNNEFVPVITDEWFLTEYYWHWSNENDGYVVWKINGKIVGEHHGPTTRNNNAIDFILLTQLYGNVTPKHQWIDDLEIRDGLPNK